MGRVLVVDDSIEIGKLVKLSLERLGHKVELASSVREGLEKLKSFKPELVLMDMLLPEFMGLKAVHEFKRRGVLVYLFGVPREDSIEDILRESGADGYITKPFSLSELYEKIEKAVN